MVNLQPIVIIPARYGSTRFPGKPLAIIRGKSMIQRTWQIAAAAVGKENVYVATDDDRIAAAVSAFGGATVMTPPESENGTERVYAAVQQLKSDADIIINLQGDAPLTPPWFIEALVAEMRRDLQCEYCTPAIQIRRDQYERIVEIKKQNPYSGAFVTFDFNYDALYFSKQIIPALRAVSTETIPVFKHVGIYAYRAPALERYLQLKTGLLEITEGLEQLRILENGFKMRVVPVDFRGRTSWAVDSPDDLAFVESIIDREGEMVPL